jgi:hypothetical protein
MRSRPVLIAGRVALWAAVIVVFGRGLVSLVSGPPARGASPKTATVVAAGEGYPTAAAEAFAARFTADYLTYDETNPADWAHRTAGYGTDTLTTGWDGKGHQTVTSVIPAAVDVTNPSYGVVTVAAQTTTGWLALAVPVAADPTGLAVAARPAFVAIPPAGKTPDVQPPAGDPRAAEEIRPTIEAFLAASAAGQQPLIRALSADGAHLPELGDGRFALSGIDTITVPTPAIEADRTAVVTLRWSDVRSGAGLAQTYRIGLTRVGERWLVTSLGPVRPEPTPNPLKEK